MIFGGYWSHITTFPFHVFLIDTDPIFKIFKICHVMVFGRHSSLIQDSRKKTDLEDVSVPIFSNIFNLLAFPKRDFLKQYLRKLIRDFLKLFGVIWCLQGWILVLGVMNTSRNLKIMKIKALGVFPKWNRKVASPKWSRIILRSFWVILLIIFTVEMTPQTP